jgi:hypothetical protein
MSRWRRARWQQIVLAQAEYLEYERDRLCGVHQNGTAERRGQRLPCS